MESTGIKDYDGNEIFVGNKVLHAWGWDMINGNPITRYRVHEITKHQEGNLVSYRLGRVANRWGSKDVHLVTDEEFALMNIPLDTDFFFHEKECVGFGSPRHSELKSDKERALDKKFSDEFNKRLAKALFNL